MSSGPILIPGKYHRKRVVRYWLIGSVIIFISTSCATINNKIYQDIYVSSKPGGASIYIDDDYYGKTPDTVTIKRIGHKSTEGIMYTKPKVVLEKEGYYPYEINLNRKVSSDIFGNIIWIFPPFMGAGVVVDLASGGAYYYSPEMVYGELNLRPGFRIDSLKAVKDPDTSLLADHILRDTLNRDSTAAAKTSLSDSIAEVPVSTAQLIKPLSAIESVPDKKEPELHMVTLKNGDKLIGRTDYEDEFLMIIKSYRYGKIEIKKSHIIQTEQVKQGEYKESIPANIVASGYGGFTPFFGSEYERILGQHFGLCAGFGLVSVGGGAKIYLSKARENMFNVYLGGFFYYSVWPFIGEWYWDIEPGINLAGTLGFSALINNNRKARVAHKRILFFIGGDIGVQKKYPFEYNNSYYYPHFSFKLGMRKGNN